MDRPQPSRRPARVALAWAVVWGLVAGAVYWSAVRTSWGQRLDAELAVRLHGDLVTQTVAGVVRPGVPLVLAVVVAWLGLVAWRAGRRRPVWLVGSVLLVTVGLSRVLRDVVLTRPDLGWGGGNTLPSNHMALSTALAGAVVVLRRCGAPRRAGRHPRSARPTEPPTEPSSGPSSVAVGAAGWTTVVVLVLLLVAEAVANVTSYAHRPADPVAGFAVAAALWSLAWAAPQT